MLYNSPRRVLLAAALYLGLSTANELKADENLFGRVRGAETLPKGHIDFYQITELAEGKDSGSFRGWGFETELEYGFTDQLQGSISLINRFFDIKGHPQEYDDSYRYRFGGIESSLKYRLWSPFKDPIGIAFRFELGYRPFDEVAGLPQQEFHAAPELILQKNYLDDTLITEVNLGFQMAWGKLPAEDYDRELMLRGAVGVSYRIAPNLFLGIEGRIVSEFPRFHLNDNEHTVFFAGPALHYGGQKFWVTAAWGYQFWGRGDSDEPHNGKTYAEEPRNDFVLKVGLNF